MKTPESVTITINEQGWLLLNTDVVGENYNIYPSQTYGGAQRQAQWGIGPVEVARILERLGIRVKVLVERSI